MFVKGGWLEADRELRKVGTSQMRKWFPRSTARLHGEPALTVRAPKTLARSC
jgi:hypothetical protein